MFCPNCGTENGDDAFFCENCGADLRAAQGQGKTIPIDGTISADGYNSMDESDGRSPYSPTGETNSSGSSSPTGKTGNQSGPGQWNGYSPTGNTVQNTSAQAKKPVSKWILIAAAEIAALAVILWAGKSFIDKSASPEQVAENYFVHLANGDWKEAYELLDIDKDSKDVFINEEMFVKAQMQENLGVINNYQVKQGKEHSDLSSLDDILKQNAGKTEEDDSVLGKNINIVYRVKGDTENSSYTVPVNREKNGSWNVRVSHFIYKNYNVYVPKGAGVSVDGVALGTDYQVRGGEEEDLDCYEIPRMFYGYHEINIVMEDMEEVVDTVYIEFDSTSYYREHMKLKEEILDTLVQNAGEHMKQIYSAAAAGKNFNTVEDLFTSQKESRKEIKKHYEGLLSSMNEGSAQLEKVRFYNLTGRVNGSESVVNIEFEYQVDYTYEDFWEEERINDTYKGSGNSEIRFIKEDGKWVQDNLGCDPLDYY